MKPYVHGMTWSEYIRHITKGDAQNVIATKARVDQSTVSRWLRGTGRIDPGNAAALARAYRRPVIEAFMAAGFLDPEDADTQVTYTVVKDPTDDELLELLRKRLDRDRREGGPGGDTPAKTPARGSRARRGRVEDGVTPDAPPPGPASPEPSPGSARPAPRG